MKNMNKKILDAWADCLMDFFYYDRKEDEELSTDDIEKALKSGEVTVKQLVEALENAVSDTPDEETENMKRGNEALENAVK